MCIGGQGTPFVLKDGLDAPAVRSNPSVCLLAAQPVRRLYVSAQQKIFT